MRRVACPVVRRGSEVLAFRHPLADVQLVKGGIEPGERPSDAAIRELAEESGIGGRARPGVDELRAGGLHWHLVTVETGSLPDRWVHRCDDDGGHDFAFFWADIREPGAFHPLFRDVLRRIVP